MLGNILKKWRAFRLKMFLHYRGDSIADIAELLNHHDIEAYCKRFPLEGGASRVFSEFHSSKELDPPFTVGTCLPGACLNDTSMHMGEFVALIPDGTIYCKNFLLVAGQKYILNKLSHYPTLEPGIHPALFQKKFGRSTVLKGKTLLIRGGVWFHFLVEGLPNLYMLQKAGHHLSSFDHIVVFEYLNQPAKELLQICGVDLSKVRILNDNRYGYRCEELLVCDHYKHYDLWFRDFFHELRLRFPAVSKDAFRRIYVSRRKAKNRRVANEPELEMFLKNYGFVTIENESLTIQEQVLVFSSAEIIIGPHGANLANIVFCHPGTAVVEFRYQGHMSEHKISYWKLAEMMQLRYALLYCRNGADPNIIPGLKDTSNADMFVSTIDLEKILKDFCNLNKRN